MSDQPLDYQAVKRAIDGDREQLRRVNARLYRIVAGMLGRQSPDLRDVLHDAIVHVIGGLHDFDPTGAGTITAWLNKIATNATIDHCRKSKRYKSLFCDDDADAEYCGHFDHKAIERIQSTRLLRAALDTLDIKYRAVLALRFFDDYSVKEIAAALDIKEGTVKSRLNRAESKIREYISSSGLTYPAALDVAHDPIKRLGT